MPTVASLHLPVGMNALSPSVLQQMPLKYDSQQLNNEQLVINVRNNCITHLKK